MNVYLYKIQCITNMHVGSGDANYSIVDNEVEKDDVLDCPMIHASGVKGALRDHAEREEMIGKVDISSVFGMPATKTSGAIPGSYKFMDAYMLTRPIRVRDISVNGSLASLPVTTREILNHFIRTADLLGCLPIPIREIQETELVFNGSNFLCTRDDIRVEDEKTERISSQMPQLDVLKQLLGEDFVIAKSLEDYPLPVIARNKLDDDKTSENLWYEEYVPHDSVFYMIIAAPSIPEWIRDGCLVQFGGNASIGCGYTKIYHWKQQTGGAA